MRIVSNEKWSIDHLINILSVVSLLSFLIVIFHHSFLVFSFTEGWYSSWASATNYADLYSSGFPFPPVYQIFYKFFLNFIDFLSIDRYFGLRLVGIIISFFNFFIIYKIAKNLGSKTNFSVLISSCSVIIFSSMEAFVIYDYTPFLGLIVSFLGLLITEKERNIYFFKINIFPFVRNIISSILIIALIGSKQSAIPIALAYILTFCFTRKNKAEIINFLSITALFVGIYIVYFGFRIGFEQFFEIYTNAEYKGGADKIIKRAPGIFITSTFKPSPGLFLRLIKEGIFFLIVFLPAAIIPLVSIKTFQIKNYWLIVMVSSLLATFSLFLIPQATNDSIASIKIIRESSVGLLIFSLLFAFLTYAITPRFDKNKKKQILLLLLFLSSIIVTNIMSGGTGAFDSFLIITLFAILINGLLDRFDIRDYSNQIVNLKNNVYPSINKFLRLKDDNSIDNFLKRFYLLILNSFKLLFSTIITSLSFAGMLDIYAKGYTWWGMVSKSDNTFVYDKLVYFSKPTKNKIPASFFMSYDQRKFADHAIQLIDNFSTKNVLAFPNIPYFYEASGTKAFARTPLNWIDVTSSKTSEIQKLEWKNNKPEIIIFNLMGSSVYTIQGREFSNELLGMHSFEYINYEIIKEIINGNYIIMDSYLATDSGYGLFTLVRKDVFEKSNSTNINYSKKQADMIKTKLEINKDILNEGFSYSTIVCMDKNKEFAKKLHKDLFNINNIDCENISSRVNLSEFKLSQKEYNLNSFVRETLERDKYYQERYSLYVESLKDNKFANNILLFSYLFSFLDY